jgi:quinolinate synthase
MILWGSACGVHTIFSAEQVRWWQERDYRVLVHPESPLEAVLAADGSGSTSYLWKAVMDAPRGSKLAIGTEGHFVRNAHDQAALRGVDIVHLAEIPVQGLGVGGCGCATMSRNDPPHLAGMLDLLRKGEAPDINCVLAGDNVDETTMVRDRLESNERRAIVEEARLSLERMIEITESAKSSAHRVRSPVRRRPGPETRCDGYGWRSKAPRSTLGGTPVPLFGTAGSSASRGLPARSIGRGSVRSPSKSRS